MIQKNPLPDADSKSFKIPYPGPCKKLSSYDQILNILHPVTVEKKDSFDNLEHTIDFLKVMGKFMK